MFSLQDVKDEKLKLDNVDGNGKLTFSGKAGKEQQEYTLDLNFQQEIDVEASKVRGGRGAHQTFLDLPMT